MSHSEPAVFVGKSRSKFFRDFIIEENFFLVFEAAGGVSKAEGHEIVKHIKASKDHSRPITSMEEFESWVHKAVFTENMPVDFSIAVGVVNGNVMYIKTVGTGEIHLRRGKDFVRVIHGEKVASGYIKEGDVLVFTTSAFRQLVEEEESLKPTMDKDTPEDIVKVLEEHYDEKDDAGSMAVFVEMMPEEDYEASVKHKPNYHAAAVQSTEVVEDDEDQIQPEAQDDEDDYEDEPEESDEPIKKKSNFKLPFAIPASPKRSKIITIAVLGIILFIFLWSVVFGYQRRQAAQAREKIDTVAASVDKKTVEAEEIAFLNMDRAIELLNESKQEVADLRKSVGKGYAREIDDIAAKITSMENSIIGKEEQEPEEFYDLALEDKNAKGTVMFLDEDKIAILDAANDTVYNFSADKKSLEKSTNSAIGDATIVGMVKGVIYAFVPGKGLYKFTDDTKVDNVIENDSDWGTITDIAFYGSNVYMLDPSRGDIYKYIAIASGYGDKTSYFNGSAPSLTGGNSIKIDSSVYVGMKNDIQKFTRGEADEFNMSLPDKNAEIADIYTDENTEKIFAWDKKHATMYIVSKTGSYERQIKASILAKATDFVVYKDQILVISGSKIYKLSDEAADTSNSENETDE